jgi:hypothetical protein
LADRVESASAVGWSRWLEPHVLSFHGLDAFARADTMLFMLGLYPAFLKVAEE